MGRSGLAVLAIMLAGIPMGALAAPDQSASSSSANEEDRGEAVPTRTPAVQTPVEPPVEAPVKTAAQAEAQAPGNGSTATAASPAAQPSPPVSTPTPAPVASPSPAVPSSVAPAAGAPGAASATPQAPARPAAQGGIIVEGRQRGYAPDPMESANLKSFAAVQATDKAVVAPAAMAYKRALPSPVRSGVHNALLNLREPVIFANFLLQHKFGKAGETLGRFAINSSVGVAGLIDVAKRKPFNLPYRPNGLADTFGFYGIKPGPYMFLPLIGPTTLRDLIGSSVDHFVPPMLLGKPFNSIVVALAYGAISGLDERVAIDPQLRQLRAHGDNYYVATRRFYLCRRQAEIDGLHGIERHCEVAPATPPATAPVDQAGQQAPAVEAHPATEQHPAGEAPANGDSPPPAVQPASGPGTN